MDGGFSGGGMGGGFTGGMAGPSFDDPNGTGGDPDFGGGFPMGAADFGGAGMTGGGWGGLSFGQGLGLSALSGLFSAIGGVLAAQEAGRQAIKLKQTPVNSPRSIAATARQRGFAPPTSYTPGQPSQPSSSALSTQPMLGSPDAPRSAMAQQLQQKMQGLLGQVGSPQLKASRFGVGGF